MSKGLTTVIEFGLWKMGLGKGCGSSLSGSFFASRDPGLDHLLRFQVLNISAEPGLFCKVHSLPLFKSLPHLSLRRIERLPEILDWRSSGARRPSTLFHSVRCVCW